MLAQRPLTATQHFEAKLQQVPAELFGIRSALVALHNVLTEDSAGLASAGEGLLKLANHCLDRLGTLENRVCLLEEDVQELLTLRQRLQTQPAKSPHH